jgi:hypothetical protein
VFGVEFGYEDLLDRDELRHDPMMAVLAGKLEARRENCVPVAGKSTLNGMERSYLPLYIFYGRHLLAGKCGLPISTVRPVRSWNWLASSARFASGGRGYAFWCAATASSPTTN